MSYSEHHYFITYRLVIILWLCRSLQGSGIWWLTLSEVRKSLSTVWKAVESLSTELRTRSSQFSSRVVLYGICAVDIFNYSTTLLVQLRCISDLCKTRSIIHLFFKLQLDCTAHVHTCLNRHPSDGPSYDGNDNINLRNIYIYAGDSDISPIPNS